MSHILCFENDLALFKVLKFKLYINVFSNFQLAKKVKAFGFFWFDISDFPSISCFYENLHNVTYSFIKTTF
jgi:hypothetical protein